METAMRVVATRSKYISVFSWREEKKIILIF